MSKYLVSEIAWFAGLFEGEGSVGVYKNTKATQIRISIGMHPRSQDILQKCLDIFPKGKLNGPYKTKNGSVLFFNIAEQNEVRRVIKLIYPYLGTYRQGQCDLVLNYIDSK